MKKGSEKKVEAEERNAKYQKLTIDQKIEQQAKNNHNGKQLKKLRAIKEAQKK